VKLADKTRRSKKPKAPRRRGEVRVAAARLDCATAFQRIALDCVANIRAHHRGACAGDAEAVHQMRVAITRLRAAVSFFGPMAADEVWRRLKRELEWLNAPLGAARDSDVDLDYIRSERYRPWTSHAGVRALDERRLLVHRHLVRSLRSDRFQRLDRELVRWIEGGPWRVRSKPSAGARRTAPLDVYSERKLERWRERLIRKGSHLATTDAAHRHRLRIRAKRYRYMLEMLAGMLPPRKRPKVRRAQKIAKRLQGSLGDLRDLKRFGRVIVGLSGKRNSSRPPEYRKYRKQLLSDAVAACRGLKKIRP
jgi:CHAD domain-containing protein